MQTPTTTSAPTVSNQLQRLLKTPWVLALSGGVLTALAWDPFAFGISAILGLALWWSALNQAPTRMQAGVASTVFGITWLGIACAWMRVFGPIAYGALIIIEGLVIGGLGMVCWSWRTHPWRWLLVPSAWIVVEAARSAFPFGGFAWAQLSHSQGNDLGVLLPLAPWLGSWGLSMLIVGLGMVLSQAIITPRVWPKSLGIVGITGLLVLTTRAFPAPFTTASPQALNAGIVQAGDVRHTFAAGISAIEPKDARVVDALTKAHDHLSYSTDLDLVSWPENSLDADPDAPDQTRLGKARDTLLARLGNTTVFAGQNGHTDAGELTNVTAIYHQGNRVGTVSKYKLVPFGEFFPYPELLSWVPSAQLIGHMVPGDGPDSVMVGQHRVGVMICYESAFASMATQALSKDAGVLVVSTNNASFADTAMMVQHLSISRLRAMEYGRPVLHASLSGPSAFISPDGAVHQQTAYLESTAITQSIAPRYGFTPARYLNTALPWVGVGVMVVGIGARLRKQSKTDS